MGFFDRLFKNKEVFNSSSNSDIVCEMSLCGQKYILSKFDIKYELRDRNKKYFQAHVAFSDPINEKTESWITMGGRKESGEISFYHNNKKTIDGALFKIIFMSASCINYQNSIDSDNVIKMITIAIPHIYMDGEEFEVE